jgi:hypothetical protein
MASQLGPASQLDQVDLRRALAEAEYRRLVTLTQVALQLGRGKRGSANLRKALEHHLPNLAKTKSVLEVKFLLLCERYSGIPPDDVNVNVAGHKVDAVWYAQKVVVELDSRLAHEAHWRQDRDHQRDVDLRAAGYTVLRYTWQQLTETPELVAADLRRALGL